MAESNGHLQAAEVVERLERDGSCAIVHVEAKHEVILWRDPDGSWEVQADFKELPDAAVKRHLTAVKLRATPRETMLRFGPQRGKTIQFATVNGSFSDAGS